MALYRPDVALLPLHSSWLPHRFVDASPPPFFLECKLTVSAASLLPAFADSFAVLIVFRFLAGCAASACMCNAAGSIGAFFLALLSPSPTAHRD
jgi:MFS family permease